METLETSTASGNLSLTGSFENQMENLQFKPVRQVICFILTVFMVILYAFYEHFYLTNNGKPQNKKYELSGPFVLVKHQQSIMKVMVFLLTFVNVMRFMAIVIWRKTKTLFVISYLSAIIPSLVVGVFVRAEFILLIIVTVLKVTNSSCSKKTMKLVIRTLRITFLIMKVLPYILVPVYVLYENATIRFCLNVLFTVELSTDFLAVNGFLCSATIFYVWPRNMSSPDPRQLPKQLGVQLLVLTAAKTVYTTFTFFSSDFKRVFFLDESFHNEVCVFDQIAMPMSIMISHFVGVKQISKQVAPKANIERKV